MNSEQLDGLLKQVLSGVSTNNDNEQLRSLTTAINKLTCAIVDLQKCIANLHVSPLNTNNLNAPISNTYAQALLSNNRVNANMPKQIVNTNSRQIIQNQNNTPNTSNTTLDPSMAKIVELKNKRNDSFYKWQRNKMLANTYESNLCQQPQRIPKKYAPKVNKTDADDIIRHKVSVALQNVENEIKTLRIHENLQMNKVHRLDNEVRDEINKKECGEEQKNGIFKKYELIIGRHDCNTTRRLNEKMSFFSSPANTVCLNFKMKNSTIKPTATTNTVDNIQEDTDIDDVSIPEMDIASQQGNAQKRRLSPSNSCGFNSPPSKLVNPFNAVSNSEGCQGETDVESETKSRRLTLRSTSLVHTIQTDFSQPMSTAISQPVSSTVAPNMSTHSLIPKPKNSQTPLTKAKMKPLSQK
jgi:hypothetical protein